MVFLGANGGFIIIATLSFALGPPHFDGLYTIPGETLSTCCHVGHRLEFSSVQISLVPQSVV